MFFATDPETNRILKYSNNVSEIEMFSAKLSNFNMYKMLKDQDKSINFYYNMYGSEFEGITEELNKKINGYKTKCKPYIYISPVKLNNLYYDPDSKSLYVKGRYANKIHNTLIDLCDENILENEDINTYNSIEPIVDYGNFILQKYSKKCESKILKGPVIGNKQYSMDLEDQINITNIWINILNNNITETLMAWKDITTNTWEKSMISAEEFTNIYLAMYNHKETLLQTYKQLKKDILNILENENTTKEDIDNILDHVKVVFT